MAQISQEQFNAELNAGRAAWPMPATPESQWTARDYQAAANSTFDAIGRVNREFPNYRPTLTMLQTSFDRYSRKARELRAKGL